MKIFPAVDILGGKAVRLTRGAYDSAKTYFDDPVRAASLMREAGAEYLHVVDLDGARSGRTDNFSLIERIVKQTSLKVEVGGGVRDTERVKAYLDSGAFPRHSRYVGGEKLSLRARCRRRFPRADRRGRGRKRRLCRRERLGRKYGRARS